MAHSYPRIGSTSKKWPDPKKQGPKCSACGARSFYRVEIQVNWFRGDDEVAKACEVHKADFVALLAGPAPALWALHIAGPDDYHAMPSEAEARELAAVINSAATERAAPNLGIREGVKSCS